MKLSTVALTKKYGSRQVVNKIDIEVNEGEVVGLLGPNGAGKTTTFYMTIGLVSPNTGQVFLDNREITKMPMYKRAQLGIGYLSQEPSIFRGLTVEENLDAIIETLQANKEVKQSKKEKLLKEFGLTSLRKQKATVLSGGEKRRCEVARALVTGPKFLLLDEPFTGIDPIAVNEFQKVISQLKAQGLGILITDHNVRETLEIIDRAYIVYEGKILLQGNSRELLSNPEAQRVYLGKKFNLEVNTYHE